MTTPTNFPLSWPLEHPRAKWREASRFGTNAGPVARNRVSLAQVIGLLQNELDRLGAKNIILSSNLELRLDGWPRGNQPMPSDPGVAVYFTLKGRPMVLPCDKWKRVECNLMAVTKHIEAIRGLERWGVGSLERHFEGFARLPEKGTGVPWWKVLQVSENASEPEIDSAFRILAKERHPDKGGTDEQWHQLSEAKDHGIAAARGRAA